MSSRLRLEQGVRRPLMQAPPKMGAQRLSAHISVLPAAAEANLERQQTRRLMAVTAGTPPAPAEEAEELAVAVAHQEMEATAAPTAAEEVQAARAIQRTQRKEPEGTAVLTAAGAVGPKPQVLVESLVETEVPMDKMDKPGLLFLIRLFCSKF